MALHAIFVGYFRRSDNGKIAFDDLSEIARCSKMMMHAAIGDDKAFAAGFFHGANRHHIKSGVRCQETARFQDYRRGL